MAVGGRGVAVAGRRVGVAVGGRRVAVGGTGVYVGVSVITGVGVSAGVSVAEGVGVSVGVGVSAKVGVKDGLGVLVGVGVTVGDGAMRDSRGQVQLTVIIIAANIIARTVPFFLFKSVVLFPWPIACCVRGRDFGLVPWNACLEYYPPTYSKVMFVNCPAWPQSTNSTCSSSDLGTGLAWLCTMSMMKG